jgi:hypothetical protein
LQLVYKIQSMYNQLRSFFIICSPIILLVFTSCINNYPIANSVEPLPPKISKEEKIRDGIETHLKTSFGNEATFKVQKEGEIFELKPQEIKDLDQMIKVKNQLPLQRNQYGDALDPMIVEQDNKIEKQKELLRVNKIYPWYEQNVLFTATYAKDSNVLYDCDFTIYPNYKIKDVDQSLKVTLSNKELSYFQYFVRQGPLFQSQSDPNWANTKNEQLYTQLFAALDSEKEYKPELLKTVLEIVNYVMTYNNFNEKEFTKKQVAKWESVNLEYLQTLRTINMGDLTQQMTKIDAAEVLSGYEIEHIFIKENESIQRSLKFTFDLNFVIISVQENLLNE